MRQGVPQGGVLSPLLFNLYMRDMPSPPQSVATKTYADDTTILSSGSTIKPICDRINPYLDTLHDWFSERNLQISAPKSSATIFSTFGNEMNETLDIKIKGEVVPTVKNPKILGVTMDCKHTYKHHTQEVKKKINSKNNILKALAGSTWGQTKEVITSTYKAIGQSSLNYCAPIYTPNLKPSNWENLQTAQNTALRIATGCVKKTPIEHLHNETKIMPVKEHNEMLSKQFLLSTQKPSHPNNKEISIQKPPRIMSDTLQTKYGREIKEMLPENGIDETNHKRFLKQIHTKEVRKCTESQKNKILNQVPPKIHSEEKSLPRKTRCTLAQLRSGYSPYLKSYLHSINASDNDTCPDCNSDPHTTPHLFNCSARPTNLTVLSLWKTPRAAAEFLRLELEEPG